jgi:hypothetical protein
MSAIKTQAAIAAAKAAADAMRMNGFTVKVDRIIAGVPHIRISLDTDSVPMIYWEFEIAEGGSASVRGSMEIRVDVDVT